MKYLVFSLLLFCLFSCDQLGDSKDEMSKTEIKKIPGKYDGSLACPDGGALRTTNILAKNNTYTADYYNWNTNSNRSEKGNWKIVGDTMIVIRNIAGASAYFKIYPEYELKEMNSKGKEIPHELSKGLKRSTEGNKI